MSNFFVSSLIVLLCFGGCKTNTKEHFFSNKEFLGKPLVPQNLKWYKWDSTFNEYGELYSNYRTLYFINDSIVYMFDCVNNKKLNCTDTSIFDKVTKVYTDTVACEYEDSILFGIENIEMYKGMYHTKGGNVICEMKKITDGVSMNKDLLNDVFTDTMKVLQQNNRVIFLYKNQAYNEAVNFKKESYKRLLQNIKLK